MRLVYEIELGASGLRRNTPIEGASTSQLLDDLKSRRELLTAKDVNLLFEEAPITAALAGSEWEFALVDSGLLHYDGHNNMSVGPRTFGYDYSEATS